MAIDRLTLELADESASIRLGADLAAAAKPGDVFLLSGDLGAGKTTLARGFIRALAGDGELDVPSPTFTLVQTYQARIPVIHIDLYRIGSPNEVEELGLFDEYAQSVTLIEWPERAEGFLPGAPVTVMLSHKGEGREAMIEGPQPTLARIRRSLAIRDFLTASGHGEVRRTFLLGDASTRTYETIDTDPVLILMNAARQPDGPPIRDGKPYSQIAHLAETVTPFVAIANALSGNGFSAPRIEAQDLDHGLLLIEHLGTDTVLDAGGKPIAARYRAAAELLASIHVAKWARDMDAAPGVTHHLPAYDRDAMGIETELVLDWYLEAEAGRKPSEQDKADYRAAWTAAFDRLESAEKSLVIRDYHSPNIIWRGDRQGHDRIGIIDFQDGLWGPSAYDVASLAQDARVTISRELEADVVAAYTAARQKLGPFDEAAFNEAYAIMAAQRNSKILGIFVRLNVRDGKPQYLKHLPRIRDYVVRALAHPSLREVSDFYVSRGLIGGA